MFHCHLEVSPVEGVTRLVCCVECQPTELMIPQSNVMGSEIPHLKGDPRDRAACCLTMSSVTVSMPRCSQDFSPLVTTDLDGRRNRMIAFCVFKAFGETLHTQREGTRFDYLKTLLPHSASRCGNVTNLWYFWPCPLSSLRTSL